MHFYANDNDRILVLYFTKKDERLETTENTSYRAMISIQAPNPL